MSGSPDAAGRADLVELWNEKLPGYPGMRYDPRWSEAVDAVLRRVLGDGPVKLLDACCGTGNPTLGLAAGGEGRYEITWSDGEAMLAALAENGRHHGIALRADLVQWRNLVGVHGYGKFDAVLCLGNSLIYAGSWGRDGDFDPDAAFGHLKEALANMCRVLRPGGILLVDTTEESELEVKGPLFGQAGWRVHDGGGYLVSRDYVVEILAPLRLRRITNFRHFYDLGLQSRVKTRTTRFEELALSHRDLTIAMEEAGFNSAARVREAEFPWPLFVGRRP